MFINLPSRVERMPSIGFSDDADYDALFTVLTALKNFCFTWVLTDGHRIDGCYVDDKGDGTFLVAVYEDSDPTGEVVRIDADGLLEVVYL
jgi:hypothetical protein